MNIAIFASGNGTNFSALITAIKRKRIKVRPALLICDNPDAFVIRRAQKAGVPVALIRREDFSDRDAFEDALIGALETHTIKGIILAGFMRVLSARFVARYKHRILNIHPSLLPAFKGAHAIRDAFEYGAKVTGVTVHFVDEKVDHGPIILQQAVVIRDNDTLESLEAKIHKTEHALYPEALRLFAEGRLRVQERRVVVSSRHSSRRRGSG